MKTNLLLAAAMLVTMAANAQTIVKTDAYTWHGDTITQGEYYAYAPSDTEIISTYSAQPHYFMPVEKVWRLKNDISKYPKLTTSNTLWNAVYNMGLDEMINAVEPDTTLRTGKEWAGVWTRDVSYSIILSMAYMQPLAAKISLMKKVTPTGRIVQDTGSGGAWPISTDRMIWALAAYELYKVNGDTQWLKYAYPIIKNSIDDDLLVAYAPDGLVRGETSFIDWREQSYPKWMQTADIYESQAMNTNMVHAAALNILSKMATQLGNKKDAKKYGELAKQLTEKINEKLWLQDKGYFGMYLYGREYLIMNPRAETLGESLAILYDLTTAERQKTITEHNPITPYGAPIFYPQIADMPAYHNNALWPWVGAIWALANAKAANEQGTLQAIGAIVRPAALFCTNKENLNLDNGDIATELNSSNMLWSLAGNLALTYRVLFGIHFEENGLQFKPFIPKALGDTRTLTQFAYRDATLNISISGYGDKIKTFKCNGIEQKPVIPTDITGINDIEIIMANNDIAPAKVNNVPNLKAPLTPITTLCHSPELATQTNTPVNNLLSWNPIEYINHYIVLRDGKEIAQTRSTQYPAVVPGVYQVIGVADDGTQSFASQPRSNQPTFIFDIPKESTKFASKEISYQPKTPISGYHGDGFTEIDRNTAPIDFNVNIDKTGKYAIDLVYANGNGPVNTENKCAIRTIYIDGTRAGVVVMPHRGVANWDDWGVTNPVEFYLKKGVHKISIRFMPENENMNIATNHALIDYARFSLMSE